MGVAAVAAEEAVCVPPAVAMVVVCEGGGSGRLSAAAVSGRHRQWLGVRLTMALALRLGGRARDAVGTVQSGIPMEGLGALLGLGLPPWLPGAVVLPGPSPDPSSPCRREQHW